MQSIGFIFYGRRVKRSIDSVESNVDGVFNLAPVRKSTITGDTGRDPQGQRDGVAKVPRTKHPRFPKPDPGREGWSVDRLVGWLVGKQIYENVINLL